MENLLNKINSINNVTVKNGAVGAGLQTVSVLGTTFALDRVEVLATEAGVEYKRNNDFDFITLVFKK